jgi:alkylhydroperoxidase family enzyme
MRKRLAIHTVNLAVGCGERSADVVSFHDPEFSLGHDPTGRSGFGAFGVIPNTARVMANSPAVLDSVLAFNTAMGGARIGPKLHNQVKLTASETNTCDYCTSIVSAVAPLAGLSAADILAGRTGHSEDRQTKAALAFAHNVPENRDKVSDQQLAAVREA